MSFPISPRRPIAAVVHTARDVGHSFVWSDLRSGMISLAGLSAATRTVILIGFALLVATAGALLVNDLWRVASPLIPLQASATSGLAGRGALLPVALVPATELLIAVAWAFGLAGAARAHWAVRVATLALYLPQAIAWGGIGASSVDTSPLLLLLVVLAPVGVALYVLLGRRSRRPAFDFAVLLLLTTATLAPAQAQGVELWRLTGLPLQLAQIEGNVLGLRVLITPMLLLAGVAMAGFGKQVADWTLGIVQYRLPGWVAAVLLAVALGLRLHGIATEAIGRASAGALHTGPAAYLGALAELLCVGAVWALLRWRTPPTLSFRGAAGDEESRPARRPPAAEARGTVEIPRSARNDTGDARADTASTQVARPAPTPDDVADTAHRVGLPLILVFTLIPLQLLLYALALALLAIGAVLGLVGAGNPVLDLLTVQVNAGFGLFLGDWFVRGWRLAVGVGALAVALWQAPRRPALALYLGLVGALGLLWELTQPGMPLASFTWAGWPMVDFWWTLLVAGLALRWLIRRELTPARTTGLLFVVVLLATLRQTDFLSSRFSPLLGSDGVAFLAFALLWDSLTAGSWANADSPGLPRVSRIYLYLGYVILTAALVNFAFAAHDLRTVEEMTGGTAQVGLQRFGRPLLYAVIALALAGAIRGGRSAEERSAAP